jgi:hypothetical protein
MGRVIKISGGTSPFPRFCSRCDMVEWHHEVGSLRACLKFIPKQPWGTRLLNRVLNGRWS